MWKGVLHNAAGAPISGAKIKLAGTGSSSEAITGPDGQFDFAPLPTGQYRLSVETKSSKIVFAKPIDVGSVNPAMAITLSGRGEVAVAAFGGDGMVVMALPDDKSFAQASASGDEGAVADGSGIG